MSATPSLEQTPPRIRRAQIVALTLLMVSGIVNYLDRGTLAVANPLIRHDLGLSLGQMGLLLSAFSWSYALFQLPASARRRSFRRQRVSSATGFRCGRVASRPAFSIRRPRSARRSRRCACRSSWFSFTGAGHSS